MRLIVIVGLLFVSFAANAQRYATANGSWTGAIWATTPGGVAGSAATPTATDDVFTNGRNITVGTNSSCRNLFVSYNTVNSISISNLRTLTITGTLSGYDDVNTTEEFPIVSVFTFGTNSSLIFTAANIDPAYDPYIIYFWDNTVPLGRVTFNFGNGNTKNTILPLAFSGLITIQTGELSTDLGAGISGNGTGSLTINSGAFLTTSDPLSSFLATTISGTLSSTESVDVSGTFTINATGVFNTSYTNPAGGWWSGASPTTTNLNAASTVNFNRSGAQNIAPLTYGNLILSGSGTIAKSLVGAGTLSVLGGLTISSSSITFNSNSASAISLGGSVTNAGTWAPTDLVTFNGTGAQSIGGTSTISFNGGLDINKSAGTLSLNRAINISNGLTISQGTFSLGSQTVTLNSGNLDNDGTFTVGSSTFVINGTTAITGTSAVSFNNLTIGGSGSLSASGTLNIAGNLANSGSLSATTVAFNGSSPQSITGNGTLTNINVTNSTGVSNNGTINLTGILTLSGGGVFDADGSGSGDLIIVSNGLTSNAGIANLTTPSNLSGNITVQRFLDGPDRYRYLSVPFTNANVGMWQDDFPVTGSFSNPSPIDANVICPTCASIFSFNSATQQYVAIGSGAATGSTALSSTVGYSAYTYLTGNFTISMEGNPVKGAVNIPMSSTLNNYSLVPNPYPAPIDWDNVNRTGTTNTIYMTTGEGSFATYVAGSGSCTGCSFNSAWRGEVAIGQSFWIQSSGGTSNLALDENDKITTSATFVREDEEAFDMFRITLQSQGKQDDMIIHFKQEATFATEYTFDAVKRLNDDYLNLSSYNTNPEQHYAINGIPLATCNAGTVKLKMSNLSGTSHSLAFTEFEKLSLGYAITLVDNFLNMETAIENNEIYSFQTTADPASTADGRFELRFTSPAIQAVASSSLSIESTCESNLLNIDILNTQSGVSYQLFKGEVPVTDVLQGNGGEINTIVLKSSLNTGLNGFNLKASTLDGCQTTTFDNILSYELVNVPQVLSVTGAAICNIGNATITAVGSSEAVAYHWYDSQLNDATYVQTVANSLTVEGISESRSYYVSTLNKNGCESLTRTLVQVEVTSILIPEISLEGTTLSSSSQVGNQWYKNGEAITGATSSSYEVTETGIYTVSVTVNTCSVLSDEITVAITGLEEKGAQIVSTYPNPVNDWLTIEIPLEIASTVRTLDMVDARGAVIGAYDPAEMRDGSMSINMAEQSKGLYYLDIRTVDRTLIYRIIKN